MDQEILTSWQAYRDAADRLLALSNRELLIFDPDLAQLALEEPQRHAQLERLLASPQAHIRLALLDVARLRDHSPRLAALFRRHSHHLSITELPEHLQHLRDCLMLADGEHALIRFDRDQPRSKLLTSAPEAVAPYRQRFEALWQEGGTAISLTPLGL